MIGDREEAEPTDLDDVWQVWSRAPGDGAQYQWLARCLGGGQEDFRCLAWAHGPAVSQDFVKDMLADGRRVRAMVFTHAADAPGRRWLARRGIRLLRTKHSAADRAEVARAAARRTAGLFDDGRKGDGEGRDGGGE